MASSSLEKAVAYHTVNIDNTSINFPFQPYDLQIEYMRKVLECVREGREGSDTLLKIFLCIGMIRNTQRIFGL
jgi:hypothetical protein